MEAYGIYSLKAGIILTVFWGIYMLFLQKETFYRFNRGFLLTGIAAAVLLPLIVIRYTVEGYTPSVPAFPLSGTEAIPEGTANDYTLLQLCIRLLPVVYLTIVAVLSIVRCVGVVRIIQTIRHGNLKRYAGYHLIELSEFDHAFSFFRFVFIPSSVKKEEKDMILKHENAHIGQKHWIDLCITNILSLMWWFNPIVQFYGKAVRNNHEYLADREVLAGYEQKNYQQTLLNQWFHARVFPIASSFSHNNNLKRINMMKKNISNPTKKLFALLAIPAIAIFLMAFSQKEYVAKDIKEDKPLILVDGKEIPSIDNILPDEIYSITVLKDNSATSIYGEKGKNGVILITSKAFAKQNPESAQLKTEMEQQHHELEKNNEEQMTKTLSISFLNNSPFDKPLLMVDGKEVSTVDNLLPEEIESISVLKENSATAVYGEKGKNGVILITTKKSQK